MRNLLLLLWFVGPLALAQEKQDESLVCTLPMQQNTRPDTITVYKFLNGNQAVSKVPGSKPFDNYSFKTRHFQLLWAGVYSPHIDVFMKRSLGKDMENIIDTLSCQIRKEDYVVLVIKKEKLFMLWCYQDKVGEQFIFIAAVKKEKEVKETLTYMEKYL